MRFCTEIYRKIDNIIIEINKLDLNDEFLQAWSENYKKPRILQRDQERMDKVTAAMITLNKFIKGLGS